MSYSRFSTGIARGICRETKLGSEQEEIIAYAIENLMLGIGGFILVFIIGGLFHAVIPAFTAAVAGGLLRRFSGGAHSSTPQRCLVFGAITYGIVGVLAKYLSVYLEGYKFILFTCLLVSLIVVSLYAPVDCKAKPIRSADLRRKLKVGSVFCVVMMLVIVSFVHSISVTTAIALGALYQSITLLPVFNQRR